MEECKKLMLKSLKAGRSVILDRCNTRQKERKQLCADVARMAKEEELVIPPICIAVFFNVGIETAKQRARDRKKIQPWTVKRLTQSLMISPALWNRRKILKGSKQFTKLQTTRRFRP